MSDARLREIERRWLVSGTTADEAAVLAERARVGETSSDLLRLAAYLGHEAAALVVGREPEPEGRFVMDGVPGLTVSPEGVQVGTWLRGLDRWGTATYNTAWLSVARRFGRPTDSDHDVEVTESTVEQWLNCPCDTHADRIVAGLRARAVPLRSELALSPEIRRAVAACLLPFAVGTAHADATLRLCTERLNALERRSRDSGDPADEAVLLEEKRRVWAIGVGELRLAAFCESESASLVLGAPVSGLHDLSALRREPWIWSRGARTRLTFALAELVIHESEAGRRTAAGRVLEALAAWLVCPCDAHLNVAHAETTSLPHASIARRRHSASAPRAALIAYLLR